MKRGDDGLLPKVLVAGSSIVRIDNPNGVVSPSLVQALDRTVGEVGYVGKHRLRAEPLATYFSWMGDLWGPRGIIASTRRELDVGEYWTWRDYPE